MIEETDGLLNTLGLLVMKNKTNRISEIKI